MAAVTLLGTATFNTTSGSKTVTATPATGDLIVIVTAHTGNTSGASPSDDQTGLFTLNNNCAKAASADRLQIFVRTTLVTAAQAVSTVYTHNPGTSTGGGLAVFKVTGMTRFSNNAILQSAIQSNQAASGTPTPVLAAAALTANALIGAVFNATNPATMTPRTSWTERNDSGYATPTSGLETMSRDSGETASSIAWGGTSASAFCSLVIELDTSDPNVTIALTGQSNTASRGTVSPSLSVAETGQSVTASQGTVLVESGVTIALTGQSLSASRGTVSPGTSIEEIGVALSAARGTITNSVSFAVGGQSLSAARGTVSPGTLIETSGLALSAARGLITNSVSFALAGQSLLVTGGTVSAGNDVVAALVGLSLSASRGTISPSTSIGASGSALLVARGSVVPAFSFKLRGPPDPSGGEFEPPAGSEQTVLSLGTVTASISVTALLTGQSVSASRGSVSPGTSIGTSGLALSVARGLITNSVSFALAGQSVPASRGSVSPGTSKNLSGQVLSSVQDFVSTARTLSLTGQVSVVDRGNVTFTNSDVTISIGGVTLAASQNSIVATISYPTPPILVAPKRKGTPLNQYKAVRSLNQMRYG